MRSASSDEILETVSAKLRAPGELRARLERVLDELLREFECFAGTIHLLGGSGLLELAAQRGLPEFVVAKIERIPVGKGMAGIAAERREAVQVCNLQTDTSGVVRPGARDTKMEGSVTAPMLAADDALRGALGIAKPVPYEFTAAECDLLMRIGGLLAAQLPT